MKCKNRLSRLSSTAIAIGFTLFVAACAGQHGTKLTLADVKKWPSKQASAYAADIGARLAKPLVERIGPAPAVLLDYLRAADAKPSYASYMPTLAEKALFNEYAGLLPPKLRQAMQTEVLGIYFIENFAGGGLSDFAFSSDGTMYCFMILNPEVLRTSLGDWISYRDLSAFAEDGKGVAIHSACSGDYQGLIHTLAHEAAHVYDYFQRATPYAEILLAQKTDSPSDKDFTRGFWDDYSKPASAFIVPEIGSLAPYGLGKALPYSTAMEQYQALAKTPFYSLYGAISWAEDFAEAVAWTWLGQKLGVTYSVSIKDAKGMETLFKPGLAKTSKGRENAIYDLID